jgi:hypothetical protein
MHVRRTECEDARDRPRSGLHPIWRKSGDTGRYSAPAGSADASRIARYSGERVFGCHLRRSLQLHLLAADQDVHRATGGDRNGTRSPTVQVPTFILAAATCDRIGASRKDQRELAVGRYRCHM